MATFSNSIVWVELSKSQADRLGQRLRSGSLSTADRRMLDAYRRSFRPAYLQVVAAIRQKLSLQPTGRSGKTTQSIVAKLKRETIRLSQIQDIAGCRLIVPTRDEQDEVVHRLLSIFPGAQLDDRRQKPSYGYRAVHVIPFVDGQPIEIQVRSRYQDLWAELSEKLADLYGSDVKYGGVRMRFGSS